MLDERGNVPNVAFSRTRSWERPPPKSETRKRKRDSVLSLNLTEGEEKYDDLENGEDVEVQMTEVEENTLCVSLFTIEGFYDVDKTGLAKPLSKRPGTPLQYSTEKRRNKINWESRRPEDRSPAALRDLRRSRIEVAQEFKSDQDETEEEEIEKKENIEEGSGCDMSEEESE